MNGISAVLRQMLGPDVGIGVSDPAAPTGMLWAQESAAMTRATPKRRAEFAAGRDAARAAMAELGIPPVAIAQGADRAPIWPTGLSGSISHCQQWCIASVANHADYATLGIDIEPATPLDIDLVEIICTATEREWLAAQTDPGLAAKMIFSAKEAVYKAQYPLTGKVIGFDAVTLEITNGRFITTAAPKMPRMHGAVTIQGGFFVSVAYK